jgi:hypothetical protein
MSIPGFTAPYSLKIPNRGYSHRAPNVRASQRVVPAIFPVSSCRTGCALKYLDRLDRCDRITAPEDRRRCENFAIDMSEACGEYCDLID